MLYIYRRTVKIIALIMVLSCTKNASAWVMLLNGASSVGKSSITNEFVELYKKTSKEPVTIIKFDESLEKDIFKEFDKYAQEKGYSKPINARVEFVKEFGEDAFIQCLKNTGINEKNIKQKMQKRVIKLVEQKNNVIIDTVIGDDDAENTFNWFKTLDDCSQKTSVFCVLVYCPMQTLLENIKSRNYEKYGKEFRTPWCVVGLFFKLYRATPPSCPLEKQRQYIYPLGQYESTEALKGLSTYFYVDYETWRKDIKENTVFNIYPSYIYDFIIINDRKTPISKLAETLQENLTRFITNKTPSIVSVTKDYAQQEMISQRSEFLSCMGGGERLFQNGH